MNVREILETHPQPPGGDRDAVARCVEACADCATTCVICADADLAEPDVADMVRCVRLDLDCADSCVATGRMASRQTELEPEVLRLSLMACAAACRVCADECERHADHHEHCRICAEVCRRCEDACDVLLATLP